MIVTTLVNGTASPVREDLAAELANAAYAVALRYEKSVPWLDLELDLWKVVSETMTRHEQIRTTAPALPWIIRR